MQVNDIDISSVQLKDYAGKYGDRKVFYENGVCIIREMGRQKFELTPMSEDTFMLKEIEFFRIRVWERLSGKSQVLLGCIDDDGQNNSPREVNRNFIWIKKIIYFKLHFKIPVIIFTESFIFCFFKFHYSGENYAFPISILRNFKAIIYYSILNEIKSVTKFLKMIW